MLGLQWKHLDLVTGWVRIEQRWYRGDLDVVKSERGQPGVTPGQSGKERLGELSRTDDDSYVSTAAMDSPGITVN